MKSVITHLLTLPLLFSSLAFAQSGAMHDKPVQSCMDMKGMDMKGMDAQGCKDIVSTRDVQMATYKTMAVVKALDASKGKVTLAHEAVKSLNGPAMTMVFSVRDKVLLSKLAVGKQVQIEFRKEGLDYVIVAVK